MSVDAVITCLIASRVLRVLFALRLPHSLFQDCGELLMWCFRLRGWFVDTVVDGVYWLANCLKGEVIFFCAEASPETTRSAGWKCWD